MIPRRQKHYFETEPGSPSPIRVTVPHRIAFSEVDALAIVWHGRYPAFFEMAQSELAFRCGLTYDAYAKNNTAAPVAQFHADYFAPLHLDDVISITASMIWSGSARINMEYEIRNSAGNICITGYTVQLFTTLDTREPLWYAPEIWEKCCERWKHGEIHV